MTSHSPALRASGRAQRPHRIPRRNTHARARAHAPRARRTPGGGACQQRRGPAAVGRAVQRQAKVGQAVLQGRVLTGGEGVGRRGGDRAELRGLTWVSRAASGGGGRRSALPFPRPYLLLLHAAQSFTDELDVLTGEGGQLAVPRAQVYVLGGRGSQGQACGGHGPRQPTRPHQPQPRPTSWMTLSEPDWTLGFLAGEATGSSCALYVTSCSS